MRNLGAPARMCTAEQQPDRSNGYEKAAECFMLSRNPQIGAATVREWSKRLPRGASVLDIGCGHGTPISQVLIQEGFVLYGVRLRENDCCFPHQLSACLCGTLGGRRFGFLWPHV